MASFLGIGADGVDRDDRPFEIRESKITPKFRLQKDVHEYLVKHKGYYIFKKGEELLQVDARDVTKMLKKGPWNKDRKYPYKFLQCRDLAFGEEQLGAGIIEDVQNQQTNVTDYYANYFATK